MIGNRGAVPIFELSAIDFNPFEKLSPTQTVNGWVQFSSFLYRREILRRRFIARVYYCRKRGDNAVLDGVVLGGGGGAQL
ncbi:hypothetical protein RRG08_028122 [Elysia crispata]|uniref:Uncharacterized protein n=1 Tax=Elysia crispata TaxID=231223 RepID=A0AAE1DRY5_9GAST|nr:hypothetical protein RRG08_028122 [Elysia crispata]